MVVTANLLSITLVQSDWPLPVACVSDTEYWTAGSRNSGRLHEILTDVEVSDDVLTCAAPIPACMHEWPYIVVIESPSPSTVTITGIACLLGKC